MAFLTTLGAAAGGYTLMRTVGGFIQKITNRIFPYEGSLDEARIVHQSQLNSLQQEVNQKFQAQLQEKGFQNQKDLAYMSGMLARQTTFLANIQNFQNTLRNRLFDDALKNFPLNIPPMVMLQNAGISLGNITDKVIGDDPLTQSILSSLTEDGLPSSKILEKFKKQMQANPIALSVFITPLQIDSRVAGKEKISTIVWDNIYQKVESLFVNEYNRSGERPVIFYPGAWNINAKPGMHASEILYFFTKGMPVIVIEPRFDGKQLRFMFSCWGVGMMSDQHIRQEISFDIDWNDIILPSVYERSKAGLEALSKIENISPLLLEVKKRMKHNVEMYDALNSIGGLKEINIADDLTKLFYISNEDYAILADMLSNSIGMILSTISDVHHLLTRGIEPLYPKIRDKYFGDMLRKLDPNDLKQLNESFANMFKKANAELLLSDALVDMDFSKMNNDIDEQFSSSGTLQETLPDVGIKEKLLKEVEMLAPSSREAKEDYSSTWESINVLSIISAYCQKHDILVKSLEEQILSIRQMGDEEFLSEIHRLAEEQGYDDILKFIDK